MKNDGVDFGKEKMLTTGFRSLQSFNPGVSSSLYQVILRVIQCHQVILRGECHVFNS